MGRLGRALNTPAGLAQGNPYGNGERPRNSQGWGTRRSLVLVAAVAAVMLASGGWVASDWVESYPAALEAAREGSRPILVVFERAGGRGSGREASLRLDLDQSFRNVSRRYVLARVSLSEARTVPELSWCLALEAAPAAAIVHPDARALAAYDAVPEPAELARDMQARLEEVTLEEALRAARAGDDRKAVALYWDVIAMKPSEQAVAAARQGLAEASRRGAVRILEAGKMAGEKRFLDARRHLEGLAAAYAGTPAGRAAEARLARLVSEPGVAREIARQEGEEEAARLLAEAREARDSGDAERAVSLYRLVAANHPGGEAAAQAAGELKALASASRPGDAQGQQQADRECGRWMSYAETLYAQGKRPEAVKFWRMVVDTYPQSAYAEAAKRRMEGAR